MMIAIGTVRIHSLHAIGMDNYKLSLSMGAEHNYGYCRDGEKRSRVSFDLSISAAEAVEWLPHVGRQVRCELVATDTPIDIPDASPQGEPSK